MSALTNFDIENKILHRLEVEPAKGTTFDHFMNMLGFQHGRERDRGDGSSIPESRLLDQTLQRLRKRGLIRFSKSTREWVKS